MSKLLLQHLDGRLWNIGLQSGDQQLLGSWATVPWCIHLREGRKIWMKNVLKQKFVLEDWSRRDGHNNKKTRKMKKWEVKLDKDEFLPKIDPIGWFPTTDMYEHSQMLVKDLDAWIYRLVAHSSHLGVPVRIPALTKYIQMWPKTEDKARWERKGVEQAIIKTDFTPLDHIHHVVSIKWSIEILKTPKWSQ